MSKELVILAEVAEVLRKHGRLQNVDDGSLRGLSVSVIRCISSEVKDCVSQVNNKIRKIQLSESELISDKEIIKLLWTTQ